MIAHRPAPPAEMKAPPTLAAPPHETIEPTQYHGTPRKKLYSPLH